MILTFASRAFQDVFSPAIRAVFWKVLGVTILALAVLWFAVREAFAAWVIPLVAPYLPNLPEWAGWLTLILAVIWSLGLAALLAMLIAPVSAIVAGVFLDDAAEIIEIRDYNADPPGKALPVGESILSSIRFFLVVIAANLVALLLLLVPGVNLIIFFVVNGYLLGREYFEFAASRHIGQAQARELRSRNQGKVLLAGFLIALFLFVPILNLLTPLFAAIFMVHLFKGISAEQAGRRSVR
jgi:CysZ protein